MSDWAYRATSKGASLAKTLEILFQYRFLWRSLYKSSGQRIANVTRVHPSDRIFLYYRKDGMLHYLGAFTFLARSESPRMYAAGDVSSTGVRLVAEKDSELISLLLREGYEPDPQLGYFTGFELVPVDEAIPEPMQPAAISRHECAMFFSA